MRALLLLLVFAVTLGAQSLPTQLVLLAPARGVVTDPPPEPPPPGSPETIPFRINCGGPLVLDDQSTIWEADRGYTGGSAGDNGLLSVGGSAPYGNAIFQYGRYGDASWVFTVTNATYLVTLGFADGYAGAAGVHVFDVVVEGSTVLNDYDIFADSGGWNQAAVKSFQVTVSDSSLSIATVGVVSYPIICWIKVEAYAASPPAAITDLAAFAGDTQASFTFTPAPNSTQTNLYWDTTSTVTTADTKVEDIQSGYALTGRTNGVQLWARVEAENADGVSALSNLVTATPAASPTTGINLYVATTGDDADDGTIGTPFLTLQRAQAEIQDLTNREVVGGAPPLGWQGATIHIADGTYVISSLWTMDGRDSGNSSFPITYKATNSRQVKVTGAFPVPVASWDAMDSGKDGWSQMDPAYRVYVNGVSTGIYQLDTSTLVGVSSGSSHPNGSLFLRDMLMPIVGDDMKLMSRYPAGDETTTEAWITIDGATYSDVDPVNGGFDWDEPATITLDDSPVVDWNFSNQEIFIYGTLGYESWVKYWQRVTSMTVDVDLSDFVDNALINFQNNGDLAIASGTNGYPTFIAFRNQLNVIGEGEYCWRRPAQRLNYRPTSAEATAWSSDGTRPETWVTHLPTLLQMGVNNEPAEATNYVTFDGIIFEGTRSDCLVSFEATGLTLNDVEIRNCGWNGMLFRHQTDLAITDCYFHDLMLGAGAVQGGDALTLTDANIVVSGTTVDDTGQYLQANVHASLDFNDPPGTQNAESSCGVLVTGNCVFSNARDGLIGMATHMTVENSTFDRGCMLTGDAGFFSGNVPFGYGGSAHPGVVIQNNTITNGVRNERNHASYGPVFAIYAESCWYWTIQDNVFTDCDQAINLAGGHNNIVRRNKFTTCNLGHYSAPVVFGNRAGYQDNEIAIPDGMDRIFAGSEPYLSAYPRMAPFRTGQPETDMCVYHDDNVIVDNMMTEGTGRMFNMAVANGTDYSSYYTIRDSVYQVGVLLTQLNYPLGSSGTPTEGVGNTPISDLNNPD